MNRNLSIVGDKCEQMVGYVGGGASLVDWMPVEHGLFKPEQS